MTTFTWRIEELGPSASGAVVSVVGRWVALVVLTLTVGMGCSGMPPCNEQTCSLGCCSSLGRCVLSPSRSECGRGGEACVSCGVDQTCSVGACVSGFGTGVGAGGGAVGGGLAAGGMAGGAAGGMAGSQAGGSSQAPAGWAERSRTGPSPRRDSLGSLAMAFDSARRRVVLFGGQHPTTQMPLDDTWEWDGITWRRVGQGAVGPPARAGTAMAYDAARGRVVLFGGLGSAQNNLQDTWEWDGQAWLARTPATSPSARCGHAMAYDPVRRAVVLFGGEAYGEQLMGAGETWEWTGSTWTRRATSGPSSRLAARLVADPLRQRLVLFGGLGPEVSYLADTWEWNGTSWTAVAAAGPPPRYAHVAAFDGSRVVVFGGSPPRESALWAFDGTRWSSVGSGFEVLLGAGLAFDEARGRLVLFGGQLGDQTSGSTFER